VPVRHTHTHTHRDRQTNSAENKGPSGFAIGPTLRVPVTMVRIRRLERREEVKKEKGVEKRRERKGKEVQTATRMQSFEAVHIIN